MRAAVADALHCLSHSEQQAFLRAQSGAHSAFSLWGHPVQVTRIGAGLRADITAAVDHDGLLRALSAMADGEAERFFLQGDTLFMIHPGGKGMPACIVSLPPPIVAHFLERSFPGCRFTPAQRRLLIALLAGQTLPKAAMAEGRSLETLKCHARDLRLHLSVETTADLVRIVTAHLVAAIAAMLVEGAPGRHQAFFDYCRRYLPAEARCLVLESKDCTTCRVVEMGPLDGRAVIALHPIILPDLTDHDLRLLHHLGLRLIWPLRHGQLAPADPELSEAEMIAHSNAALDLVTQTYCKGPVPILSFAASSKLALAYARHRPGRVETIFFAAACDVEGRPVAGARRLARGMMTLGGSDEGLQIAVAAHFTERVLKSGEFMAFLRAQFAGSPADQAMVEDELAAPRLGRRMQDALVGSLRSVRHDFQFQRDLGWDQLPPGRADLHFIHGSEDVIHPFALIAARVARIPGAKLHRIEGAGQLLYGPHFAPLLQIVAGLLAGRSHPGIAREGAAG